MLDHAPKLRVGLFVKVAQGQVQGSATAGDGGDASGCSQFTAAPGDPLHYRYVDCARLDGLSSVRIRLAAIVPTVVVVRDYYPLFSIIRPTLP